MDFPNSSGGPRPDYRRGISTFIDGSSIIKSFMGMASLGGTTPGAAKTDDVDGFVAFSSGGNWLT